MTIYAIVLQAPDDTVWDTVKAQWPDRHYLWHDTAAFIAPVGITTAEELSETLGFNAEEKHRGVVIDMTVRSGYGDGRFVEWIRNAAKENG